MTKPDNGHRIFSRVTIHRDAISLADLVALKRGDVYREHALLWRLFRGDGLPRDFLFRAEKSVSGLPIYFVVSKREPHPVAGVLDVEIHPRTYPPALEEGMRLRFSLRANPTVGEKLRLGADDLDRYNIRRTEASGKPAKLRHDRRSFHDVIMSTKKALGHSKGWNPSSEQLRQLDLQVDQAARSWVMERLPLWGLRICVQHDHWNEDLKPALLWDRYEQHDVVRPDGKILRFSSIDYEGEVEVVAPALLATAMVNGVGRAKAFGCGLLLVRPA